MRLGRVHGLDEQASSRLWDGVVACASEEGELSAYQSMDEATFKELATAFAAETGIKITSLRDVDGNLLQKLDAEMKTKKLTTDLLQIATPSIYESLDKQGALAELTGPAFDEDAYAKDTLFHDVYAEIAGSATVMAWNASVLPDGPTSMDDLLDPSLSGRIGVIDPSVAPLTGYYVWYGENLGEEFVEALAAQKPRIYPGSAALLQALGSGEIVATPMASPPTVQALKGSGSPLESLGITGYDTVPGSHSYTGVLADGPHPCAAQVWSNWVVTPEAQTIIAAHDFSAVLPGVGGDQVESTMIATISPDKQTPEFVKEYHNKWAQLFQS